MKKLQLTGAVNYNCRNPDLQKTNGLTFKSVGNNGLPITYELEDPLGAWLLQQSGPKGVPYFSEVIGEKPGAVEPVEVEFPVEKAPDMNPVAPVGTIESDSGGAVEV